MAVVVEALPHTRVENKNRKIDLGGLLIALAGLSISILVSSKFMRDSKEAYFDYLRPIEMPIRTERIPGELSAMDIQESSTYLYAQSEYGFTLNPLRAHDNFGRPFDQMYVAYASNREVYLDLGISLDFPMTNPESAIPRASHMQIGLLTPTQFSSLSEQLRRNFLLDPELERYTVISLEEALADLESQYEIQRLDYIIENFELSPGIVELLESNSNELSRELLALDPEDFYFSTEKIARTLPDGSDQADIISEVRSMYEYPRGFDIRESDEYQTLTAPDAVITLNQRQEQLDLLLELQSHFGLSQELVDWFIDNGLFVLTPDTVPSSYARVLEGSYQNNGNIITISVADRQPGPGISVSQETAIHEIAHGGWDRANYLTVEDYSGTERSFREGFFFDLIILAFSNNNAPTSEVARSILIEDDHLGHEMLLGNYSGLNELYQRPFESEDLYLARLQEAFPEVLEYAQQRSREIHLNIQSEAFATYVASTFGWRIPDHMQQYVETVYTPSDTPQQRAMYEHSVAIYESQGLANIATLSPLASLFLLGIVEVISSRKRQEKDINLVHKP